MTKTRFSRKKGMKRPNSLKVFKKCKNVNKNRNGVAGEAKYVPKQSTENDSEDWSEGEIDTKEEGEEVVVVNREATMYDNLLKKLGSKSELVANAFKRRKKEEEGISDTEDDESENELEDKDEGSDNESPRRDVRNGLEESDLVGSIERSAGSGSEDEVGTSESDEEHDSRLNAESIAKASSSSSVFSSHLEYKLSQGEVDNLLKRKWNYKCEVPALGLPNCKWTGTGDYFMKDVDTSEMYGLKPRLYQHWLDIYKGSGGSEFQSSKQRFFFSICNSYRDILHHNRIPFYVKGTEEDSCIMDAYLMHSLNHTFRTRDLVSKNDAKLATAKGKGDLLNGDFFLDHGFTRPKVLILLPLASIAFRVVKRLIQLTPPKHKVIIEHIERFTKEFGSGEVEDEENEDDVKNPKTKKSSKPSDFQALFGGNNNDHFMIGVKYMGRKMKLFADFYSSDIIVASPLGLITKIGEAEIDKEKDVDYLSSIEVLIIDHADVILMQNWTHVNTVVAQLNRLPVKQHGTDIMRIRPWYLDGQAQF